MTGDQSRAKSDPSASTAGADAAFDKLVDEEIGAARSALPPSTGEARAALETTLSISRVRWALIGCNAMVFWSSLCVMVLELTASRLIAQHLGASLYTWTSVIGVVLAGLSAGNFLGGWLADRHPPAKTLGWLFLISGLLTFSVLWLNQWAGGHRHPSWCSWQVWVILVVSWIFLLPSIALGTISPVVASLALSFGRNTGMTVGSVSAWGTIGSILGTFLAGFVLIDRMGSQAIIQVVSAMLLGMGAIVAVGRTVFRVAVVLGAMQFVGWCGACAWADEPKLQAIGEGVGRALSTFVTKSKRPAYVLGWDRFGARLGRSLHEVGRILALRSDNPDEYNDESNYFAINVATDTVDGDTVKELKLDHLLHSYWNENQPDKLYYDYERVYAAVTERASQRWSRAGSVRLEKLPVPAAVLRVKLPEGLEFDEKTLELRVRGAMSEEALRKLLALGPYGDYWQAVWTIHRMSQTDAGGYLTAPLSKVPDGLSIPGGTPPNATPAAPTDLAPITSSLDRDFNVDPPRLRYDAGLEALVLSGSLSFSEMIEEMARAPHAEYVRAVARLYEDSRRVRTLFIGGGGFVFPRWIESRYPGRPVIDVAEIDPAVKLAVQAEMGLPDDDKTAVRTHIGDARKFIEDQVRANVDRAARGEPLAQYDFAYGDAFNDFSVPWHLTTREFSEKVKSLLDPNQGVYLVNIIDIYARAEFPGVDMTEGKAETTCAVGELPGGLGQGTAGKWIASNRYSGLSAKLEEIGLWRLKYTGTMTAATRDQLLALAPKTDLVWRDSVRALHDGSRERRVLAGPVPPPFAVEGIDAEWAACPAPFNNFELRTMGEGFLLGYRGVMSEAAAEQARAALPSTSPWRAAIDDLQRQSLAEPAGAFLGRYVRTLREVFPYLYVFSSNEDRPGEDRDTFVVAASLAPLDMTELFDAGGHWRGTPFAWSLTTGNRIDDFGQMRALLELSRGFSLTDNFAPVDNLLAPVFVRQ
jgi:MFS family permease